MIQVTRSSMPDFNEYCEEIRDIWDSIKCTNILIIGVPEGEEGETGPEKIFENMIAENLT